MYIVIYYGHFCVDINLRLMSSVSWLLLVKLSVLARKTPLRKPNRGERIVSIKPRLKNAHDFLGLALCGLRGCKNRPAPFPGRMSYKATKPGLVLFAILACFNCIVAY